MEQKIVLVIVVLVSIWAHVWIFRWLAFKVNEGTITRFLKDKGEPYQAGIDEIANTIAMNAKKIRNVAEKSKELRIEKEVCFLVGEKI